MTTAADLRSAVAANPLWYHTLDLPDGVVTPGWFDLRPVVGLMPWPDVRGKRCLDVATYDGFFAFELERRGASEVVAIDIESHEQWDWAPRERARGTAYLRAVAGEKGRGFEIARDALGSTVDRRFTSVYDLDPVDVGTFDVVVCGSLLLHLRDPFRALDAMRRVCRGFLVLSETIDVALTVRSPRRAAMFVNGDIGQWLVPNARGVRRMAEVAGFSVLRTTRPYAQPFGEGHPPAARGRRERLEQVLTRGAGVPTVSALCRPDVP